MSKEEIKTRFKETKLGKKIFKRFKIILIMFIIVHVLMLTSFIFFIPKIGGIISGKCTLMTLIFGIILLISAILSFIFSIMLVHYDGKIVGCIELFDLMLKAKTKKKSE